MPNYIITGRSSDGTTIATTSVSSIDQDGPVIDDMTIVNAARTAMASGVGVTSVLVRKYDQIITVV
jgi:hypothetical protein